MTTRFHLDAMPDVGDEVDLEPFGMRGFGVVTATTDTMAFVRTVGCYLHVQVGGRTANARACGVTRLTTARP